MSRKTNKHGGGAKTNENGLLFEQSTSLVNSLSNSGFTITNDEVFFDGKFLGYTYNKHNFYSNFLSKKKINYEDYNSIKWLPDDVFINEINKTVYIIEKKFQNSSGSVDEKLATFQFKIYEYKKLLEPINYNVQYIYLLSDWFKQYKYKDYFDYMNLNNCSYYFNKLPLESIGI